MLKNVICHKIPQRDDLNHYYIAINSCLRTLGNSAKVHKCHSAESQGATSQRCSMQLKGKNKEKKNLGRIYVDNFFVLFPALQFKRLFSHPASKRFHLKKLDRAIKHSDWNELSCFLLELKLGEHHGSLWWSAWVVCKPDTQLRTFIRISECSCQMAQVGFFPKCLLCCGMFQTQVSQ